MTTNDLTRQFTGKVAIVTGGTQGLGEAVARLLAERGIAGLLLCGRSTEKGEAIVESLAETGCQAVFVTADLGLVEDCRRVVTTADTAFGRVDIVVNVAAMTDRGTILDTSPELFDALFAINVRAPFFLMQDAAKIMRREEIEGSIVNIQSMSGHGGQPFVCAYSATKAALSALTKNVAFSLMPDRIRVNGLNIGWMDTPGENTIQLKYHTDDAEWLDKAEHDQPFGRLLKTDEVARAVAYLASDESGMMTGSVIDFDQQVLGAQETASHPSGRLPEV
ncbi:SDR family oxidoreductase [Bauldia sp.]|uniref:SDR family oxidoreductase n=1 Tax=Bauldia sp. TaxID=2575872 RepID=UPI003BAC3C60